MHTSEELSSFTIEIAMFDSNTSSIQHYQENKTMLLRFYLLTKIHPHLLEGWEILLTLS